MTDVLIHSQPSKVSWWARLKRNPKRLMLYISLLLFLLSLTQPAFYIDKKEYDAWASSIGLVVFGWAGALAGGAGLAWLANPFIFVSWILFKKKIILAALFSIIASGFAISFLFFDKVLTDEGGGFSNITAYKAGYWLWLLSIVVFACAAVIFCFYKKEISKRKT